jgi:hypothetical protein
LGLVTDAAAVEPRVGALGHPAEAAGHTAAWVTRLLADEIGFAAGLSP